MMKMRKQIMLLLATATLFAACGGNDDEAVTPAPQPQQPRMLTVEVSERPLQTEGTPKAPRRADAATTTETLNTFRMCTHVSGSIWSEELTKTAGKWTTKWPSSSEEKYNFYAYNVGNEFVWNGGDPYVSFTMEKEVANQKDFLVAKTAEAKSWSETGGKVSLTFDHACAAVQFFVFKEEESATYVVKEIQLQNVYKQGDYHFNNNTWSDLKTPTYFTLTTGDITPSDTKTLLPKEWLYVIPQSKEGMKLQIKYTKNGGTETTKLIDLSGSWAAGNQYTVNIKIGK